MYRMVSFYGKVRNNFVSGQEIKSFECVSPIDQPKRDRNRQNVDFSMRTLGQISNLSIFIELFRIMGEYCNFAAASLKNIQQKWGAFICGAPQARCMYGTLFVNLHPVIPLKLTLQVTTSSITVFFFFLRFRSSTTPSKHSSWRCPQRTLKGRIGICVHW